jgi:tetratricopeptide (TPR) repeat protein
MRKTLALAFFLFLTACGGSAAKVGKPVFQPERGTEPHATVSDDQFARAVKDLLAADPGTTDRQTRLTRVCEKQMSRARARFPESPDRGLSALSGAVALVHHGELDEKMIGSDGVYALDTAARELSRRGDESRARAIYEILARVAPENQRPELRTHISAIEGWTRDTGPALGAGPIARASAASAFAARRALTEPSKEAQDDAIARTATWVKMSVDVREAYRARKATPDRDELREAVRGLAIGGTTLALVHLRDGDAVNALDTVDRAHARDLLPKEFAGALEHAANEPTPTHFLDLTHALRNLVRPEEADGEEREEREAVPDVELIRAATLGTAFEAYRLDSTEPEAALGVAVSLLELGMAEAAPLVLSDSIKAHDDPRLLSAALAVTMRAMSEEVAADDLGAARRAFNAAQTALAASEKSDVAGKLSPTPGRVFALMGEVELREGNVAAAKVMLTRAAAQEKNGLVLLQLARIDRWEQHGDDAIQKARAALSTDDAAKDAALRGETWLFLSDVARDAGEVEKARGHLATAVSELTRARGAAEPDERARIERTLARVLDRYGAEKPAGKALERALDAAPRDRRQAAATIGQLVSRAFLRDDLKGARDALGRGLALDIEPDGLVYEAVWVRLLERQQKVTPVDPAAERILAVTAKTDQRWLGKIAAFGLGTLSPDELRASAKTPAQQTEALFYAAIAQRTQGDARANDTLKQVIAGGGLDLIEVTLARDMLAGPRRIVGGPVPEGLP